MRKIETKKAPGAIGPYSQAFETNGFVITSGQIPVDPQTGLVPDGIEKQAPSPSFPCLFPAGTSLFVLSATSFQGV